MQTFKDLDPIKTIENIRKLLSAQQIFVKEYWHNIGPTIYSVNLSIPNTSITSNGKGISEELALASGYGELMERLSFLLPFRVSSFHKQFYQIIFDSITSSPFYILQFEDWISSDAAKLYFKNFTQNQEETIKFWQQRITKSMEFQIGCGFYELAPDRKQSTYKLCLPISIVDYYYGSNGMCAGNSKEEALVQGISEIIERFVQRDIILEKNIAIYDVTESALTLCTSISLNKLFDKNYHIKVLKCLSDLNIPVFAAILFNNKGDYYVSFGCHPCELIAVERTITELCQGYSSDNIVSAFSKLYSSSKNESNQDNYINLIKFGVGRYSPSFICGNYPKANIIISNATSNVELLQKLISIISSFGYTIYAAPGLSSTLYTFHVIIPGMSEVQTLLPESKIRNVRIQDILENTANLDKLNPNEINDLIDYLSQKEMLGITELNQILQVDKYEAYNDITLNTDGIELSLFIALLYIKIKRWNSAQKYMIKYFNSLYSYDLATIDDLQYYRNVIYMLDMLSRSCNYKEILCSVGDNSLNQKLLKSITNGSDIFCEFPDFTPDGLISSSKSLSKLVDNECGLIKKVIRIYLDIV